VPVLPAELLPLRHSFFAEIFRSNVGSFEYLPDLGFAIAGDLEKFLRVFDRFLFRLGADKCKASDYFLRFCEGPSVTVN
jgi:hypothetical protein